MGIGSNSPIYDVLLLAHIVCALGGFGANGLAGFYASQLYPRPSEAATRYFGSPRFLAEKLIYLVPVFGLILIGISRGPSELAKPWVLIGIAAWIAAVAIAHSVVWPAERRVSQLINTPENEGEIQALGKRLARGAMALNLIFVTALVVMIIQIGGK
ncbi:MAG: hypothetical protein HKL84_10555 [Acidimicrobiaceae bacterium]|nr:hypothetical protein [Acidimicrobiaceae bacterium]